MFQKPKRTPISEHVLISAFPYGHLILHINNTGIVQEMHLSFIDLSVATELARKKRNRVKMVTISKQKWKNSANKKF